MWSKHDLLIPLQDVFNKRTRMLALRKLPKVLDARLRTSNATATRRRRRHTQRRLPSVSSPVVELMLSRSSQRRIMSVLALQRLQRLQCSSFEWMCLGAGMESE